MVINRLGIVIIITTLASAEHPNKIRLLLFCRDTLALKGSTVIDATVAGVFCNAVYSFHTSGLGGGFVLTYYRRLERTAYVLNAREISPLNVTAEFCAENTEQCRKGKCVNGDFSQNHNNDTDMNYFPFPRMGSAWNANWFALCIGIVILPNISYISSVLHSGTEGLRVRVTVEFSDGCCNNNGLFL